MTRSKPDFSGLSGCFGVLSMLGDGLVKALSFGFPQRCFFVARRKHLFLDWTFGQWTLPFEFLHIPRCDIFIDWTFGQWTLLLEFLHIPRCSLIIDWTFGQWTLLFEFSPYSSVQSIYILDIWTMDITI